MSLTLHLDVEAWRRHLAQTRDAVPGLVPVAKGNGYGYGLARLADEATRLGVDVLAVGTSPEVAAVRAGGWRGDVVVLTAWSALDPTAVALLDDPRVITTVGRLDDLAEVGRRRPGARVIVELLTSMCRFGIAPDEVARVRSLAQGLDVEGWTIHLPLKASDGAREAAALAERAVAAVPAPVWLSHLSPAECVRLGDQLPVETRLRMGTKLWLGAPGTRRTSARVLDVHPVRRGQKVGYWQHRMPRAGHVVVVAGGTAHGVALSAPTAGATLKQRLTSAASGAMEAAGFALSPFTIGGRKRTFVEPPHMQSSLVFVPAGVPVAVGDEVPVELRLTTATLDEIVEG